MTRVAPQCVRAFLSLRSTHRSRVGSHGDYFRTRLGFRDNFSRKSMPPFVSRIKFALLFSHIQRHRLFGTGNIPFYSCFFLSPLRFHDGRNEKEKKRDREREGWTKWGCRRIDIGSFQTSHGTKRFLHRTSRTNELSFRIVNLPRNEMKRWNDVLDLPFLRDRFYGNSRPYARTRTRGLTMALYERENSLLCRATSNNYFYGLFYKDYNGKYEDFVYDL